MLITVHNSYIVIANRTRVINSYLHCRYYGVCCLNQFTIGPNDEPLAVKLVEIYFCFFKVSITIIIDDAYCIINSSYYYCSCF